jgi:hypothetical protein
VFARLSKYPAIIGILEGLSEFNKPVELAAA